MIKRVECIMNVFERQLYRRGKGIFRLKPTMGSQGRFAVRAKVKADPRDLYVMVLSGAIDERWFCFHYACG